MISNVSSNPLHRAFCIRLYLFVYRFPMSDAVVTICHTPTLRLSFSYLTSDHFWLMSNNEYLHSQMSASPGPPPAQCCQWLRSPAPGLIGRVWRRPASSSASLRPPSRSRRLFFPGPSDQCGSVTTVTRTEVTRWLSSDWLVPELISSSLSRHPQRRHLGWHLIV